VTGRGDKGGGGQIGSVNGLGGRGVRRGGYGGRGDGRKRGGEASEEGKVET